MIWLLLACGSAADRPDSCADQPVVTWESFGHGFMTSYCVSCHSTYNTTNRYGAPENVNFDTEADTLHWKARIQQRVLEEQTMPLGGGVYPQDLYLLGVYLGCGE